MSATRRLISPRGRLRSIRTEFSIQAKCCPGARLLRARNDSSGNENKSVIGVGVYLIRLLEACGVDVAFGIPGVHTIEFYRELAGSMIRHVTPRHEQGAGFMAMGYARVAGKPGVCFTVTGPGLSNIATALAQAHADSIPILAISTVNAHGRQGSGDRWLHELPDQRALARQFCACSETIDTPNALAPAVARAFALIDSERPRPAHVELPINVMLASAGHLPAPGPVER